MFRKQFILLSIIRNSAVRLAAIIKPIILISYPFLVFFALKRGIQPRFLSILLLMALLFQFGSTRLPVLRNVTVSILLALIIALCIYNTDFFLKLYPFIVNFLLFVIFILSLKFGPPIIERFARIRDKRLTPSKIEYCRKITMIWCIFFVINGSIAFYTIFLSLDIWILYNGLISYILMGSLMAAELLYRYFFIIKSK